MMPYSESLKDTLVRVIPFWTDHISQYSRWSNGISFCTRKFNIAALIKYLEDVSE